MNRLTVHATVTVNLPPGSAPRRLVDFDCRVLAVDGSCAILEPFRPLPDTIPRRLEHVLLAFEHGRSLVGLKGVLTRHGTALAFAVEDGVEVPRRRVPRLKVRLEFTARNLRTGEGETGTTRDVSVDGALLETALAASMGDRLALSIVVPEAEAVAVTAVVVRESTGLLAVSYAGAAAAALERFISGQAAPVG
jgi:hypothetical protein